MKPVYVMFVVSALSLPALSPHAAAAFLSSSVDDSAASPAAASFSLSEKTQIPGVTLKPGDYSIRVVDRLTDRMIMRVDSVSGNTHVTFIGLLNKSLPKPSASGAIPYSTTKGGKALRGYSFENGPVVEFVYPKGEAASLAKFTSDQVPAIDPESEGRVAAPKLSKEDMQLVTLWMLSTTRVGNSPAIKAERYQNTATQQTAASTPSSSSTQSQYVASTQSIPDQPTSASTRIKTSVTPPVRVASIRPRPDIKALPHTASGMPILWGFGLLSFAGAAMLSWRRVAAS